MTVQRHATDHYVADYYVPEPSIPTSHDSFELTEDAVIIYGRDPGQWIWTDTAVQRRDCR
jgi:hypothetical protein